MFSQHGSTLLCSDVQFRADAGRRSEQLHTKLPGEINNSHAGVFGRSNKEKNKLLNLSIREAAEVRIGALLIIGWCWNRSWRFKNTSLNFLWHSVFLSLLPVEENQFVRRSLIWIPNVNNQNIAHICIMISMSFHE